MRKDQIGPMQLIVMSFDEPNFTEEIANEIKKLNDNKVLRLIDGLAIQKDHAGKITAVEATQLSLEQATEYGAIIGSLIGLGMSDEEQITADSAIAMADNFHDRYEFGLDREDIKDIVESIPKGSAVLLMLVEHLWAITLRESVRDAGGLLISQDFLSPEMLGTIGQEIYAEATA